MTSEQDQAGVTILHTSSGAHRLDVKLADSFLRRLCGLMLRAPLAPDAGLLLTKCPSVHTAFMRQTIDVAYLDRDGVVQKCVQQLRPWRASASSAGRDAQGQRYQRAAHTLELAAGTIERLGIRTGDRIDHPRLRLRAGAAFAHTRAHVQSGSALVEFVVVGPIMTIIGLGLVQYAMLFHAKNQINHAAFVGARAASVEHASMDKMTDAYAQALVPLYGGGQTAGELATSLAKAKEAVLDPTKIRIEMLNPTRESFADYNDPALQAKYKTGAMRVIPNANQSFKTPQVNPNSGQTIQDANLIKYRITQGYEPKVPIVASIYKAYQRWLDPQSDAFHTALIEQGMIPVVTNVTVQMQSDAIEDSGHPPVSNPGEGNHGNPTNPGDPPTVDPKNPPDCPLGGCTTPTPPSGSGGYCPAPISTSLAADTTFAFGSSTLTLAGKASLDKLVTQAKALNTTFSSLDITGYTDPIGNADANLKLSQDRADAVSQYLNSKGLTATQVNVVGKGSTNLKKTLTDCPGNGDATQIKCLAEDRRVDVVLKP